jgi:hypothetical protein
MGAESILTRKTGGVWNRRGTEMRFIGIGRHIWMERSEIQRAVYPIFGIWPAMQLF